MKKVINIIVLFVVVLSTTKAQEEKRELENFSTLKVSNSLEVVLIKGENNEAKIVGVSPDKLEHIKTEVSNGVLSLSTKGSKLKRNSKNLYYL